MARPTSFSPTSIRRSFSASGGHTLLLVGLVVSGLGLLFGLVIYKQLKNMPVHQSMLEISELIYATCKTYLIQQGKFLMILWVFIGAIVAAVLRLCLRTPIDPTTGADVTASRREGRDHPAVQPRRHRRLLRRGLVRHPRQHLRQQPHGLRRRSAASRSPATRSRSRRACRIGMALISVELLIMLVILLFVPGDYAGPCFIGFAIGESLGAAALRIAGGIFTKIADIGSDLMKIVFKIKEDDARNPGVIADCVGDNAGDSVGPSADGFETYGVTGVALITFILLAVTRARLRPGPAAGLDLRDAHHHGDRQRPVVLHQRGDGQGPVRQRRQDELRDTRSPAWCSSPRSSRSSSPTSPPTC